MDRRRSLPLNPMSGSRSVNDRAALDKSTSVHLMQNQESSQPKSSQDGGWGCWLLAVFVLTPIFPVAAFVVLMAVLFFLCVAHRWAAVVLGLTLAVACVIGAFVVMTDPKTGDAAPMGLLFLPWAGLGLWMAARGFSKK